MDTEEMKEIKWDIRDRYLDLDNIEEGETFLLVADLGQMGKRERKIKCESGLGCGTCVFSNKILGVEICMIPLSLTCTRREVIYTIT